MSDISSINRALYRPIFSGMQYNAFMPYSDCSSVFLGKGDTKFSIDQMKQTALKYQHHTKRLTKRFFNQSDIKSLVSKVHYFLYNHLQYKLDGTEQKLRSPACSWASRQQGIDCKSYSIFASCILLNAGISHYMRRIKQKSFPNGYSHVYVVVPKNQKTNDLKEGYYTIDGTIDTLQELPYLEADDIFVQGQGQGLGCVSLANPQISAKVQISSEALGDLINQSYHQAHHNMQMGAFSQKQKTQQTVALVGETAAAAAHVVDLFLPGIGTIIATCIHAVTMLVQLAIHFFYDPCASTFYTADYINNHLEKEFLPRFKECLVRVEQHVKSQTEILAVDDLNTLLKEVDLGYAHFMNELNIYKDDECSGNTLKGYYDFVKNLKVLIDNMLFVMEKTFKNQYKVSVIEHRASTSQRRWYFVAPSGKNPIEATYRQLKVEDLTQRKGVYPFASEETFEKWASDNAYLLSAEYGSQVGQSYLSEVRHFGNRIREIRENIYLPVSVRFLEEEPLQKQQEIIYLKYDTNYAKELIEQTQQEAKLYAQKQVEFWKNLQKIYQMNLKDEKRRFSNIKAIAQDNANMAVGLENKKMLNIILIGLLGWGIISSTK